MIENLKSLIQQHLPAMAAGEMKIYIENAENNKSELEKLKVKFKQLEEDFTKIDSDLKEFRYKSDSLNSRKLELDAKEKILNKQEFNLELAQLKYMLKAEQESKDSIFKLVQTLVQNPRAIEITSRSRTYNNQTDYSPQGGVIHYPISSNEFETKERKEEK